MLPSKTIPDVKNRKGHALKPKTTAKTTAGSAAAPPKKKSRISSGTEVEIIKDNERTGRSGSSGSSSAAIGISPASSFQMSHPVKVCIVS
jgi:hypothetical protein